MPIQVAHGQVKMARVSDCILGTFGTSGKGADVQLLIQEKPDITHSELNQKTERTLQDTITDCSEGYELFRIVTRLHDYAGVCGDRFLQLLEHESQTRQLDQRDGLTGLHGRRILYLFLLYLQIYHCQSKMH